jgi:hypothetical protein
LGFAAENPERLPRFGFKLGRGGVHAARTMMLPELRRLLDAVPGPAARDDYRAAVVDDNVLDKPTSRARRLTFEHLSDLYALDPGVCLYRVFRRLWDTDPESRPALAVTLALARDTLLRVSAPVVLDARPGEQVTRARMEDEIRVWGEGRFSDTSVEAIAQRVNGTWTRAGYLVGKVRKVRRLPVVTPANVCFALFFAYLDGRVAQRLFSSDWVRVLDLPAHRLMELARAAAERDLLVLRRTGDVVEIRFPDLLTEQEQDWLHEQA